MKAHTEGGEGAQPRAMATDRNSENDREEWWRLMLANARGLYAHDYDHVARTQRFAQEHHDFLMQAGSSDPRTRSLVLGLLRDETLSEEVPDEWPEDRDEEEFENDGAGGRLCPFYHEDCHDIMQFIHDMVNPTHAETAIDMIFSFPAEEVADVYIGTNHETETGTRPRGAPHQSDGLRPITELPNAVLFKLFGNVVFPRAYYCLCDDPAATALLSLKAHKWPNGHWFVMRCGDRVHAWKLRAAAPGRSLGPPREPATIFGNARAEETVGR